jgi:hypothetical protein
VTGREDSIMLRTLVGGLVVLALAAPASAKPLPPPPGLPQRLAWADRVIVGTVESIEEKPVKAPRGRGDKEEVEFQVAVIKIDDAIAGAKGLTHIRVGFIPPESGAYRRGPYQSLTKGQEACFFLSPHGAANFHIIPDYYDLFDKKDNANFDKEIAEVKRCAKLLADPAAGLASEKADERYLTAAMLLTRYRVQRPYGPRQTKTESLDAKESRRLLEILAEADWYNRNQHTYLMTPAHLFGSLGLTENDGWKPPQDFSKVPEAAKKWLKENAGTYRVQRFVPDK